MQSVKSIIISALGERGMKKRYTAESAIYHWREIVGEKISLHAKAQVVQHGVLLVIVTNSVWCHHLSMIKKDIMTKINAFVGDKLINDIRFQAGKLNNCQNNLEDDENMKQTMTEKSRAIFLNYMEQDEAKNVVKDVKDEKLQNKLFWLTKKQIALQKIKKAENWHPCCLCSTLCPPNEKYCVTCNIQKRQQTVSNVRLFLSDAPWMDFAELSKYIECTQEEFFRAKDDLIEIIKRDVYRRHADNLKISTLAMLITGMKPGEITDDVINKTVIKFRGKKNVSAPGK